TGSGDHRHERPAEFYRLRLRRRTADFDDRGRVRELAAGKLVRRENRQDAFHTGNGTQLLGAGDAFIADRRNDGAFNADQRVRFEADFFKAFLGVGNFGFGCAGMEDQNHWVTPELREWDRWDL